MSRGMLTNFPNENQNININITNRDINSTKILIKYSSKDHRFAIYNNDIILGSFIISQIIKYITNKISKEFLRNMEYESSVDLIEKYICKYDINDHIILISYLDSPLMGNIEIIMKIYSELNHFENNLLLGEFEKYDISDKIKNIIIQKIKDFTYSILNHSLKIIVNISDTIKNDETKKDLKNSLIKYSIFFINKINYLIYDSIGQKINEDKLLEIELEQLKKIKQDTNQKIKNMEIMINKQNEKIDRIIEYMKIEDLGEIDEIDEIDEDIINSENNNIEIKQINNINELVNDHDFKDSDYSYTETNKSKTNINYLSE